MGEATPALAATPPMTASIGQNPDASGTRNKPTTNANSAGAMSQRVVLTLIKGENTTACITNITRLHSVNISATWYGAICRSCLPRKARPTSNTPTAAETMKVSTSKRLTTSDLSLAGWSTGLAVGTDDRLLETTKATSTLASAPRIAVDTSGMVTDSVTIPKTSTPIRPVAMPSVGPSRNPAMLAILTNARRRPRCWPGGVRSPIVADAMGVTPAANRPLENRWT